MSLIVARTARSTDSAVASGSRTPPTEAKLYNRRTTTFTPDLVETSPARSARDSAQINLGSSASSPLYGHGNRTEGTAGERHSAARSYYGARLGNPSKIEPSVK